METQYNESNCGETRDFYEMPGLNLDHLGVQNPLISSVCYFQ